MEPILIRRQPPKHKVNDFLIKYARNITSQSGEDGILMQIFHLIDKFENNNNINTNKQKWCAEFGCWDGKHLCNTNNLIVNHGWNGILIEADSEKYQILIKNYKKEIETQKVIALNEFVGFNQHSNCSLHILYPNKYKITTKKSKLSSSPRDFDEIIDSLNLNLNLNLNKFDLIIIDIDGNDYHVFDSIIKYQSKVIMIEFNPTIPNNIIYIQSRDMNI